MKQLTKHLFSVMTSVAGCICAAATLAAQTPAQPMPKTPPTQPGAAKPTPPPPGKAQPGAVPPGKTQPGAGNQFPATAPKAAQPAQPAPGTGTPAVPATPGNPNAAQKTQDTPSRTGQTPARKDEFRNNPVLKDDTSPSTSTNTTGRTGVSGDVMIKGLVNLTNITNINIQPGNIVNINTSMNGQQIQTLMQSLNASRPAQTNAQALTARLRQQGLLQKGQSVVGFADGQVFVNSGDGSGATADGNTNNNNNTSGDVMIRGLVNLTDITNVNVQPGNIVNVNGSMNATQVQTLMQSLSGNADAQRNAQALTERLRRQGLLQAGQTVVGFTDGRVFINSSGGSQ